MFDEPEPELDKKKPEKKDEDSDKEENLFDDSDWTFWFNAIQKN